MRRTTEGGVAGVDARAPDRPGGEQGKALERPGDRVVRQPVVAMPPVLIDSQQPATGQQRQVLAPSRGGNPGDARQLGGRARLAIHQSGDDRHPCRLGEQRGDGGDVQAARGSKIVIHHPGTYPRTQTDASVQAETSRETGLL